MHAGHSDFYIIYRVEIISTITKKHPDFTIILIKNKSEKEKSHLISLQHGSPRYLNPFIFFQRP